MMVALRADQILIIVPRLKQNKCERILVLKLIIVYIFGQSFANLLWTTANEKSATFLIA
jgi:hypothetical protein